MFRCVCVLLLMECVVHLNHSCRLRRRSTTSSTPCCIWCLFTFSGKEVSAGHQFLYLLFFFSIDSQNEMCCNRPAYNPEVVICILPSVAGFCVKLLLHSFLQTSTCCWKELYTHCVSKEPIVTTLVWIRLHEAQLAVFVV